MILAIRKHRVFKKIGDFNRGITCIKIFSIIFAFLSYNYETLQFVIGYQDVTFCFQDRENIL